MSDSGASKGRDDRTVVQCRLEDLDDPWRRLRDEWATIGDGGTVLVRYGATKRHLRSRDVANLLRLTGFDPSPPRKARHGLKMEARRRAREVAPLSCTVVVPCRDEADNVEPLLHRLPSLGTHTELVFVDGASTDGTPQRIEELIRAYPQRDIKLLHQRGKGGKAEAVFTGFDAATGDVLIILDADMTVAPEALPQFYEALATGMADLANGTRFVYPMDTGAMRGSNHAGNRAFSVFLSALLGTRVTDTLCGTKALFQRDWPRIAAARPLFGGHDSWGDFDLLLGAAYVGLRIVDVPVRYGARQAGESKMRPLHDGLALARTTLAGARHLKLASHEARSREI